MNMNIRNNHYYLKHYDETILSFEFITEGLSKGRVLIDEILRKDLIPFGLECNNDNLLSWLKDRMYTKNRKHMRKLYECIELDEHDTQGILDITKGLSLNDVYWTCSDYDKEVKFDDINLYENDFSETLSLVAFTGVGTKIRELWSSPEFTTKGALPKCWRRIDVQTYLYKGATEGFINAGKEPYMEFYASQIAKKMGYDHVEYDLTRWKGILASTCPIFTDKDTSYIPIGYIVQTGGIAAVDKFLKELPNKDIYRKFRQYILFNSVIANDDAHYGNFGVLINNKTNEIIDMAPIFDNGGGLFCYATLEELDNIDKLREYVKTKEYSYYGLTYDDLISEICDENMIHDLTKLHNFHFTRHSAFNLSDQALKNLEIIIHERVNRFEKIPRNSYIDEIKEEMTL